MTETPEEVLERHSKELDNVLKSTDEGKSLEEQNKSTLPEESAKSVSPNVDTSIKEDWKEGYTEHEVKTKESSRLVYKTDEIEVIEEDINDG